MTTLLLIRHGESEANRNCIFAGQIDPELTDTGRMQAKITADYIAGNYKVDKVYSSDLVRAYSTALSTASEFGIGVIKEPELREIDAGLWEGVKFDELKVLFPEEFDMWLNDIGNAGCVGGESIEDFGHRIVNVLTRIAKENEGKTVAIATHATPIRAIQSYVETGDFKKMQNFKWVSNASVTVMEYDGDWHIKAVSIDKHLNEIRTFLPDNV